MFSLIITIISIVLVGLLAVATIYYGGDAFSNRGDEARADRILNEGQQLSGAAVLAKNDGKTDLAQTALVTGGYLNGNISGWTFSANAIAAVPESAPGAGDAVPAQAGYVFTDASVTAGVCAKISAKTNSSKIVCDGTGHTLAYAF